MSIKTVIDINPGILPLKRAYFGLCLSDTCVYIYGGEGIGRKLYNDFWYINGMCIHG